MQEILRNRESGTARLVSEYRDRLYSVGLSLCRDPAEAEDLVFRTIEKAVEKIEQGAYEERNSFCDWMHVILLNLYRNSIRGKVARNTVPAGTAADMDISGAKPEGGSYDGASEIYGAIDSAILREAIDELPPDMKEAVLLHYFMDLPLSKMAKMLATPAGTLMSRLYYARLALGRRLGVKIKKKVTALLVAGLVLAAGAAVTIAVATSGWRGEREEVRGNREEIRGNREEVRGTVATSATLPATRTVTVNFGGARTGNRDLYVASGAADGGEDIFAWDRLDRLGTLTPAETSYEFTLPADFVSESRFYRFFLTQDANYQEIEYAENSGTYVGDSAFFSTGLKPDGLTLAAGEVENTLSVNWANIFGCCDKDGKRYFHLGMFNGQWFTETMKLTGGETVQFGTVASATRYSFAYCATNAVYRDATLAGAAVSQHLLDDPAAFGAMDNAITVFRTVQADGETIYDRPFAGRIYSLSFEKNGAIVRDYVPVRNASGVAGFYDTVAKTFHPSESSVPFAGGAAKCSRLSEVSVLMKAFSASDPATARWTGAADGALDDPANWLCRNESGVTLEGALPQPYTTVSVSEAAQFFGIPAGSGFDCAKISVDSGLALSADVDWRGIDFSKIEIGGNQDSRTIDICGRRLMISVSQTPAGHVSFADSAGGGELHVAVPAGVGIENGGAIGLAGAVALVKEGAGTFVAGCVQPNTGGVRVEGGVLKTSDFISTGVLGPAGTKVVVGRCGTLLLENAYTGLENHNLELAGGTLHFLNSAILSGRSAIGSMVLTDNSTLKIESTISDDAHCDTELASGAVWNLGGHELVVVFMTIGSDLMVGRDVETKPVLRNGTVLLDNPAMGYWQDWGSDAREGVRYRYAMKYVRQRADATTFDLVNDIPADANVGGSGTMSVYGTYTPNSQVAMNLRMMSGSTIDLGGVDGVWSTDLGGTREMDFESGGKVYLAFGAREFADGDKVVSWDDKPANVAFGSRSAKWSLSVADDGIYVNRASGLLFVIM